VILSTLSQFKGHRIKTAGALGIGVRTLGMKLKRWKEDGEVMEHAEQGA
jgi:DNA-binding NtrC family response regulator